MGDPRRASVAGRRTPLNRDGPSQPARKGRKEDGRRSDLSFRGEEREERRGKKERKKDK